MQGGSSAAREPLRNAPLYEWEEPGKGLTVRLSLDVVERLGPQVVEAAKSLPGRGVEVGGLLLGRALPGDRRLTVIEDFEPLESEHLRGPSFLLSGKDRKTLEGRLKRAGGRKGYYPVGYYRSHTRPGLYLDQEDFSLISSYFTEPGHVFLLLRPASDEPSAGAFFFWEEADIRRQSPYHQFPFDTAQLLAGGHRIVNRTEISALAREARPVVVERAAKPAAKPRRLGVSRWLWVGAALVVILLAAAIGIRRLAPAPETASASEESSSLSLKVEKDGNSLVLSWDRESPALRGARGAILWITDDAARNRLDLDEKQLKQGQCGLLSVRP